MLRYATELASLGYYVFQTSPNGKQPNAATAPHGCIDATRDIGTINKWFQTSPEANLGIKCENILVLDLDVSKGDANGLKSLDVISKDLGALSDVVRVTTPSGGAHLYFQRPHVDVLGQTNVKYKGQPTRIDIRVGNQYVVAPGSTVNGKFYEGDLPPVDKLPRLPQTWIDKFLPKKTAPASAPSTVQPAQLDGLTDAAARCARYIDSLEPAVSGSNGHNQFLWAARVIFWGFGLDDEIGRRILENYNARCQPPFSSREVEHKIESAKRGDGYNQPYGWLRQKTVSELTSMSVKTPSTQPQRPQNAPIQASVNGQTAASMLQELDIGDVSLTSEPDFTVAAIKRPDFILYPFFREAECCLIYAQRGVGKTWFALSLARAIANGHWLFGMPIWFAPQPRKVWYLDGEMSAADMQERLQMLRGNEPPSPNLFIDNPEMSHRDRGIDLFEDVWQTKIITKAVENNIDVIIVDNLATLYHCPKPNDSENWRQYDKFILTCRKNNIACIIVDHCGKNNESGAAGSYAKQNIVNHCIQLDAEAAAKDEGSRFWVQFQKSRSCYGTAILPMLMSIKDGRVRHIFRDADKVKASEPVENPPVEPDVQTDEPTAEPSKPKKGDAIKKAMELIKNGATYEELLKNNVTEPTYRRGLARVNAERKDGGKEPLKSVWRKPPKDA